MKLEKWTIALVSAGAISLGSTTQAAEESPVPLLTSLSATTISGYVDVSAHWNFGTGNANMPPYKFGGPDKADGFNLDVVQLSIERPLEEKSDWTAGYKVDLWLGPDANTLGTQSILASATSDFALRQAYVLLRAPVGNGLDIKFGVFDSVLGYESVAAGENANYTRSYGHSIEPQTHTGVLLSYQFCDAVSASAGVANTFGPVINSKAHGPHLSVGYWPYYQTKAESYKTYMASLTFKAPESMGWAAGSTLKAGVVNGFDESYQENVTSVYVGGKLVTPVTGLTIGAAWDYFTVHNWAPFSYAWGIPGTDGSAWSVAAYASYQATQKLSLHLRGEHLNDSADRFSYNSLFGMDEVKLWAVAATIQYDLWQNVLSRLEFRWDYSPDARLFGGTSSFFSDVAKSDYYGAEKQNAFMLAANIVLKF